MGDYNLIRRICEGEFPPDQDLDNKAEITAQFFERVEESGVDVDELLASLPAKDEISRVYTFKRFFRWVPPNEGNLSPYRKNGGTSSILREIGKAAQAQKNLKEALKYYNLSVAYAPIYSSTTPKEEVGGQQKVEESDLEHKKKRELSKDFMEIVTERAEILLQVRGGEEALRDVNFLLGLITSAPDYDDPDVKSMMERLKEIQSKCLKFLEEKACFMIELAGESILEMERRRKYKNLLLFKVKKPNPLIPSAESFVEIKEDPVKGRCLILNRDIPAGTTVIVEDPFVKVLKDGLKWEMGHCAFCLVRIRGGGGIPCPTCVFEIYCSETCRDEAWVQYHAYECPCLPYFHSTSTPRYIHLAFRIVCSLGPKELYRLFITKDPKYFHPQGKYEGVLVLGCVPGNGTYSSTSYLPIYHLVAHAPRTEVEYIANIIQGLIYAYVLDHSSTFFQQPKYIESHPREYFRTFVAGIILHHLENIPPNSISVDELVGLEGISLLVKEPTILGERIRGLKRPQVASATYALSSLINHSCEPNVTRLHDLTGARMAVVTLRGLKAGEELLTSYTKIFLSDTTEERRDYLQATYNFTCDCIPCIQKWPVLAKISETEPRFCCSTCVRKLATGDKASPAFYRCILDKKGICRGCKKGVSSNTLRDGLDQRIESFFEAYELILKNRPLEAIRLLGPCSQFFQDNVCPPYNKIYMSQDQLKTAWDLVVHYSVPRT